MFKKLKATFFIFSISLAQSIFAQSVSTPIVGFQKSTLPANSLVGLGVPLLNPTIISGQVSSKSSAVIAIASASQIGSALDANQPYYVEVVSTNNNLVGSRFEVDVAATKTSNNGTITLVTSSIRNTSSPSATDLVGSTVQLRKHVTLDQIRRSISGTLTGDDSSASSADSLLVFSGVGFLTYWLGADLQSWYSNEDPDDHRFDVIAPGEGFLFRKKGSAASLVTTGTVRNNDYRQVLRAGFQLNAPGYPLSYSPDTLGAQQANGWQSNDQILIYSGVGFSQYSLDSDGAWTDGSTPDAYNSVVLVSSDAAFMTKMNQDVTDIETKPTQ
ncbi:MAG: hypothetical protein EBZ61_09530 [Micrococcales bacterium]|nr:hypothetical protein [Micrococcales bacterium]